MSNQLHLYGSQQFAFPPAVCLLLALFILRNKGSPDNSPPESFMEMGFDTALQIFFGFFSTWRRKSPKQTFIWHCKVENNSYSPLKGSGAFPAYGDATLSGTRNYSCSILFKTKTGKTKQKNLPPVCNKLLILGSF